MEYDLKFAYVDWGQIRRVIEQLIPTVTNIVIRLIGEKESLIKELEESNMQLRVKLNQMTITGKETKDNRVVRTSNVLYRAQETRGSMG